LSVPIIAFFNNKGGVGKTTLVYHLAWMYADLGLRVLAADLDPQANLTAAFLDEERLEEIWPADGRRLTVYGAVRPLIRGTGDIEEISIQELEGAGSRAGLLPGDLMLSAFEAQLSEVWPKCMDRDERSFRVTSAFYRVIHAAAQQWEADLVLMDLGPNLGAINRASLISAYAVVIPLSPDLFSLQGLRNLGPALREWRQQWGERRKVKPSAELELPEGRMEPAGYVIQQHSVRLDRPVRSYEKWISRIPGEYHQSILNSTMPAPETPSADPECLSLLKHYRSLVPMAQEAGKPIFHLKPADGAIGSHYLAVQEARRDFESLARRILTKSGLSLSTSPAGR